MSRLSWDEYFINIAIAVSKRSTCLRRQYGAVIVKDNKIISTGYNGPARGIENCCDINVCLRQELGIQSGERYDLCRGTPTHAEMNAIINGDPDKMKNATLYVAGIDLEHPENKYANSEPCKMCKRVIRNALIGNVVFVDKDGNIKNYNV